MLIWFFVAVYEPYDKGVVDVYERLIKIFIYVKKTVALNMIFFSFWYAVIWTSVSILNAHIVTLVLKYLPCTSA